MSPNLIVKLPHLGLVERRLLLPQAMDVLKGKAGGFGCFDEATTHAKQRQRRPLFDGENSRRSIHLTTQAPAGWPVKSLAVDWFNVGVWFVAVLFCLWCWLALGFWLFGLRELPGAL